MSEALLFVPGMLSDARIFWPQIEAFSAQHPVQVAAFAQADTISEMARATLASAPERFALVGHSMGGIVAMEILRHAPERVSRVALVSTTPLAETPAQAAWREPQIARARAGHLEEALTEALPDAALAPGAGRAQLRKMMIRMAKAHGGEAFIRHSRALQRRRDGQRVLLKARMPALVLCGAHDALTPVKRHEAMAELLPDAELVVLEDAGHVPMFEAPEAVNRALTDWLARPLRLGA